MQRLKVLGPPGTGKTRYLLEKLEEELKTVSPNRIAFLTFTRAARLEALGRVKITATELPYLRTIHSICYRELGVRQGQIVKPRDLRSFGLLVGARMTGNLVDPWLAEELGHSWETPTKADMLLQLNHLGRHNETGLRAALQDAPLDLDWAYSKWFTEAYSKWKEVESLVDYTDLLTAYLAHGQPLPIDVMFVDEAQDLSKLQWDVVRKLGSAAARWYLAGDDDQAIYTWAGASAELFINQPVESTFLLDQSYRLPARVHDTALDIITQVDGRLDKPFRPREAAGTVGPLGFLDETVLDEETLILFRNHHRGGKLAKQLEQLALPFLGSGSVLSDPTVRAALRGWYLFCAGEKVQPHEAKAILTMSKPQFWRLGVQKKFSGQVQWADVLALEPRMEEWSAVLSKLPNLEYLEKVVAVRGFSALLSPNVTLLSIHQSKGRQAHTVVLDTEMAAKTYKAFLKHPDDEHRVWYVGVTRAFERLFVLTPMDMRCYQL